MNDEKSPASLEQIFARLEADSDAIRPYFIEEIKADLERRGIDTTLPLETRKLLEQASSKRANQVAATPSPVQGVVEAVQQGLASAAQAGQKITDHVQETATALAAGVFDFFVTSPALPMRAGSGTDPIIKLRIPPLGVRVTFQIKDKREEKALAWVVSLNDGQISNILDGGIIIANGKIVGRFADGHAVFAATVLAGQFGLRDSQGKPLELVVEK